MRAFWLDGSRQVLESYYAEVLNFVTRSVGCRDKAQNVVQEAYVRILAASKHKAPKTDSSDDPKRALTGLATNSASDTPSRALFFATAKNIVIDQYRYQQRHQFSEFETETLFASPADEPEQIISDKQQLDLLYACIDNLPLQSKQAFVLYKFKGLSYADIAIAMGISQSSVEKHLIAAMLACRKHLKK